MSEKKPKPPRPPAPNISKKAKRPITAATISFRNSPLGGDSDGGLSDDEDQRLSFFTNSHSDSKSNSPAVSVSVKPPPVSVTSKEPQKSNVDVSKRTTLRNNDTKSKLRNDDVKGSLSSKELEDLIDSFGDPKPPSSVSKKKSSVETNSVEAKPSPHAERGLSVGKVPSFDSETPSVDEKSSLGERTSSAGSLNDCKIKEEPKAINKPVEKVRHQQSSVSNSHSAPSLFNLKAEKEKPAKPQRPLKQARSLSGLMTVSNEVLKEEDGLPELPKDSMTDPLSFLDKFMDDEEEDEFVPVRNQKKPLAQNKRAKSWDGERNEKVSKGSDHAESEPLNIDQFHYSVPTPAEVKDEPVRFNSDSQSLGRTPPEMSLTLSGLLASSTHHDEPGAVESKQLLRNESPPSRSSPDLIRPDIDSDKELSDLGDLYSPSTPKSPESLDEEETESPKSELIDLEYTPPGLFLLSATLCVFAILVFPLPASLIGFFSGMAFAFYLILFVVWLSIPQMEREYRELEDPNTLPPLHIPGPRLTASKVRVKEQNNMIHKVIIYTFALSSFFTKNYKFCLFVCLLVCFE